MALAARDGRARGNASHELTPQQRTQPTMRLLTGTHTVLRCAGHGNSAGRMYIRRAMQTPSAWRRMCRALEAPGTVWVNSW